VLPAKRPGFAVAIIDVLHLDLRGQIWIGAWPRI
jgi:hypothetical protein